MKICDQGDRFHLEVNSAHTYIKRLKGLMFKVSLPAGEGLLLSPCSGIHTCFMRFPIDVVYLNREYKVLDIETVAPWRLGKHVAGTKLVLETTAGSAKPLEIGTMLVLERSP